jgi:hypothetical protein
MFHVTPDGSVLDRDGRIIYFSLQRLISDIANGDCCFICGAHRTTVPFNDEHVLPDWILRRFALHGRRIQISNQTYYRYGRLTVPCCVSCNTEMGARFERPLSSIFAGGFNAVSRELKDHGPWLLFCWMALIFLKAHLKDKSLNYHLDHRKGDMKIGEFHSWEELHHLHCVARAFHSKAVLNKELLGSLAVLPAKIRPHFEGFDFIDLSLAQTMLLVIGDVAIIAVFNDSGAALTVGFEDIQKIGGPLSPIQLRELAARFAAINLQVEPRARFMSTFDATVEEYSIVAERPDEVHCPAWDNDVLGKIMYEVSKDLLAVMKDRETIGTLVRSGRYTFLTTPEGRFDMNSMELEAEASSNPESQ